jgi:hypothetical protein
MPSAHFSAICPAQQGKLLQQWDLEAWLGGAGRSSVEESNSPEAAKCQKVLSGGAEDCQIAPPVVTRKPYRRRAAELMLPQFLLCVLCALCGERFSRFNTEATESTEDIEPELNGPA